MAEYLILLCHDETAYENAEPDVREQISKEHSAFAQANRSALRGGNALQPTLVATSIRRDVGGELMVTDARLCADEGGARRPLPRRGR